ncbi:MAG: HlyD family efflux transporter periplasmic adaptor subunit [Kiritimatiellae bacterium]|nr:HlyD family efflux transporter periplasmic adaptor subunit [Kiritimatiellia bacterium]
MKAKKRIVGAVCAAAALGAALFALGGAGERAGAGTREAFAVVRRGTLTIDLAEDGEIKPSQQLTLKSEVEGRHSIIYIVPEGTLVKEGDTLVELDVATLVDDRVNQEIAVTNAASGLEMKREDLEIAKNQAASDIEIAEQDLQFAREDLVKYEEGEYPNRLNETKGEVALAEQTLEQAREKYEWSKKLHAENFLSESELKSDELAWRHSALALETARGNLELLVKYTYKREVAKLRSDAKQKEAALERVRRKSASSILQEQSALRAKESEYNRQKQKLEKIEQQISKAKIVAPMDGQAIYATSNKRPWDNQEPLKEGVDVWERRDLIILPTADTFIASVSISESALPGISTGMTVRISCDAIPGREFAGSISKISPIPDAGRRWMNPDIKEYPVEIAIDGGTGELKNGMGCRVSIRLAEYEDAVSVPVQCVVREGGEAFVWVKAKGGTDKRRVETGLDNNRFVHILSGLEGGEEVSLVPPLGASAPESANPAAGHGRAAQP